MDMKIALLLFLLAICCVCLPVYRSVNKGGFKVYAVWVGAVCIMWCFLVFCTDIIC